MIRRIASEIGGERSSVRVFGSRLGDSARGGDVDLLLELQDPMERLALIATTLPYRVSKAMHGRKVDVLLCAPNLVRQPCTTLRSRKDNCYEPRFQNDCLPEIMLAFQYQTHLCCMIPNMAINSGRNEDDDGLVFNFELSIVCRLSTLP